MRNMGGLKLMLADFYYDNPYSDMDIVVDKDGIWGIRYEEDRVADTAGAYTRKVEDILLSIYSNDIAGVNINEAIEHEVYKISNDAMAHYIWLAECGITIDISMKDDKPLDSYQQLLMETIKSAATK